MRLVKFLPDSIDPIRAIGWVIAIFTLVGGAYIFTPLYTHSVAKNGLGVVASVFSHPALVFVFGAVLVISSLMVIFGLWKGIPRIKSAGFFGILLTRFFQVLTTFMVSGFLPITWIYPMTIVFILIILWAHARWEVKQNADA